MRDTAKGTYARLKAVLPSGSRLWDVHKPPVQAVARIRRELVWQRHPPLTATYATSNTHTQTEGNGKLPPILNL